MENEIRSEEEELRRKRAAVEEALGISKHNSQEEPREVEMLNYIIVQNI